MYCCFATGSSVRLSGLPVLSLRESDTAPQPVVSTPIYKHHLSRALPPTPTTPRPVHLNMGTNWTKLSISKDNSNHEDLVLNIIIYNVYIWPIFWCCCITVLLVLLYNCYSGFDCLICNICLWFVYYQWIVHNSFVHYDVPMMAGSLYINLYCCIFIV